ncbi:MAG: peptidoglycan editing factor PgeF [Janthinobacterium lividum]
MTGPESLTSSALPVRHGFFTRRGGVSTGPYASLNGSLNGGDDRTAIQANRDLVMHSLGAAAMVGLQQVHGPIVITVDQPWAPGAGPRADAMVTRQPGIALGIITADCAPVLLADPAAGVIGAVHAGWRGAVAGVLEATVAAMATLGAEPARIAAAVGPCIRQPSYEVGADLRDAVLTERPNAAQFFADATRPDHWQFDLAGYCAMRLSQLGRVDLIPADTAADPERFFSHRRRTLAGGGPIGHQMSAITL